MTMWGGEEVVAFEVTCESRWGCSAAVRVPAPGWKDPACVEEARRRAEAAGWQISRWWGRDLCPRHR